MFYHLKFFDKFAMLILKQNNYWKSFCLFFETFYFSVNLSRFILFLSIYFYSLVQRISPDTSSKVQLQIVFHNDSSYNLHFMNKSGREAQVKDRDEVKEMLAELIPQHRQKASKDLEEKNRFCIFFFILFVYLLELICLLVFTDYFDFLWVLANDNLLHTFLQNFMVTPI